MSHLFGNISCKLAVVENFAFAARMIFWSYMAILVNMAVHILPASIKIIRVVDVTRMPKLI